MAETTQQHTLEEKISVIVCVDDSEYAEQAFNYYAKHIHKPQNEVIVVHVAEMVYPMEYVYGGAGGRFGMPAGIGPTPAVALQLIENEKQKNKAIQTKFCSKSENLGLNHKFVVLAETGDGIGASIVEEAKKRRANLIIIGSRGQGVIRRTILGSVSDYVLHHSHVPTLVCHKRA